MTARVRRIGNSRGVIIPAALLAVCGIEAEAELRVQGRSIIIEAMRRPRQGWFDGYTATEDVALTEATAWDELAAAESPSEEWQW